MVMNLQIKKFVASNHSSLTTLDLALKKDGNYYLQVFLKECKYI